MDLGQERPAEIEGDLLASMESEIIALGELDDQGRSFLIEIAIRLDGFRVILRPNEGKHRGRPHCLVEANDNSATFDIVTGERLAGDLKKLNRTVEKVVRNHSDRLLERWDESRPDDQRLS
jgi:hypothetical protein